MTPVDLLSDPNFSGLGFCVLPPRTPVRGLGPSRLPPLPTAPPEDQVGTVPRVPGPAGTHTLPLGDPGTLGFEEVWLSGRRRFRWAWFLGGVALSWNPPMVSRGPWRRLRPGAPGYPGQSPQRPLLGTQGTITERRRRHKRRGDLSQVPQLPSWGNPRSTGGAGGGDTGPALLEGRKQPPNKLF